MIKEPNGYEKIMSDFITVLILNAVDSSHFFPDDNNYVTVPVAFPKKVLDVLEAIPSECTTKDEIIKSLADLIYKSFISEMIRCSEEFNKMIDERVSAVIQKASLLKNVSLN